MNDSSDRTDRTDRVSTDTAHGETPRTGTLGSAATLLGAEMLEWSDLDLSADRRPAGGPAAAALLHAVVESGAGVLVAGPHTIELLEQIAAKATTVDVLVRSVADADLVAERLADRSVHTYAGGLDRFRPEHGSSGSSGYDLVVVLDGIERLTGPDSQGLTWAGAVGLLRDRLAPGGRMLLGLPNGFGLDRLLAVPDTVRTDDEWARLVDERPPAGLGTATTALAHATLSVEAVYSLYADPTQPALAVQDPAGPDDAATVARLVARHYAGRATLTDPYRTGHDLVLAGHGTALAPGHWLVLGDDTTPALTLPGRLGDDPARAGGPLVEEVLLAALRADDEGLLRAGVQGYVDWLRSCDPDTAVAARPDDVVATGTAYRLIPTDPPNQDPSETNDTGETGDANVETGGSRDVVVVRQLARFVTRALASGGSWPWPVGATPRTQTAWLASMTGLTVDDALWQAAGVADDPVEPQGRAEQLSLIARLSAELAEARVQAQQFEAQVHKLRNSRSYRVGRAVVTPLRATYGKLRSRVR